MNKSEIIEKIKKDSTKIYGEPIFDIFLKTTDNLSSQDFLNLSNEQKEYLSGTTIYNMLADNYYIPEKFRLLLSKINFNINKLSDEQLGTLFQNNDSNTIELLNYIKNLNNPLVTRIIYSSEDPEKIAEVLGDENLNKISSNNLILLIKSIIPPMSNSIYDQDENSKVFIKILNSIKKYIKKINSNDLAEFITDQINKSTSYKLPAVSTRFKEIEDIFGELLDNLSVENLKQIIERILKIKRNPDSSVDEIFKFLGKHNINKLSNDDLLDIFKLPHATTPEHKINKILHYPNIIIILSKYYKDKEFLDEIFNKIKETLFDGFERGGQN